MILTLEACLWPLSCPGLGEAFCRTFLQFLSFFEAFAALKHLMLYTTLSLSASLSHELNLPFSLSHTLSTFTKPCLIHLHYFFLSLTLSPVSNPHPLWFTHCLSLSLTLTKFFPCLPISCPILLVCVSLSF